MTVKVTVDIRGLKKSTKVGVGILSLEKDSGEHLGQARLAPWLRMSSQDCALQWEEVESQ